jgi:putative FmdB family regulatory protein
MPIYEYQCRKCGAVVDVRHGYDETHTDPCATCGGEMARRYSPAGIVFKGSGFYVTDSRKSSGEKSDDSSKKESAASADSGSSKAESTSGSSSSTDSGSKGPGAAA